MSFPLGKPILLMALIAAITGPTILLRSKRPPADLTLWVFAELHAETYRSVLGQFQRQTGRSVNVELLNGRAMPVRLQSMFMSNLADQPLPDLVELEIGWVGRFFRPPLDEVGLAPLNTLLKEHGWNHRIVQQRLATWSKQGTIFGVPHDVHPVTITYRKDLFDEAGIDLASASSWAEFQEKCLQFQAFWRARGYPLRQAIELPQASAEYLSVMLLQRGVNLVDDQEKIHFTDPKVAQTIAFYAQLVAGQRRIAAESAGGAGIWTNDAIAGNFCAMITADWRIYDLKKYAPGLSGKMRMMPLPRFDPTDPPTSTFGGTMMGITRNSTRHDDAWKLIKFLYLSPAGLQARQEVSNILPSVIEQWNDPTYHREDPYFGGQKVDELYIQLARQIPRRYVTPASSIASTQLSIILNRAVNRLKRSGPDGLVEECTIWCAEAAEDLRRRIDHGKISG